MSNSVGAVVERSMAVRIEPQDDHVWLESSEDFVNTPYVQEIANRALTYLDVGYAVHFAGPPGTGKTTLALHVAALRRRPVTLVHGDEEFGTSDLVGNDAGYKKSTLVDNFIHTVLKTEEEMKTMWVDNRLTTACRTGDTLVYDEFNRSRPEANNVLLSILSENVLNLPRLRVSGDGYLQVHPDFRAIFTSNPEEYAGVHKAQDALMDRLITIHLDDYDQATETAIAGSKGGLEAADAAVIVGIVREMRAVTPGNAWPTIRASIAIAKVLSHIGGRAPLAEPHLSRVCKDVLWPGTVRSRQTDRAPALQQLDEIIAKHAGRR